MDTQKRNHSHQNAQSWLTWWATSAESRLYHDSAKFYIPLTPSTTLKGYQNVQSTLDD